MKSQMTLSIPTMYQGHFFCGKCQELTQEWLRKREFSHSRTEEMHVERQVLICKMKHMTYLIMYPWDMQCVCKATKALKVIFEEHKSVYGGRRNPGCMAS